MPDSTTAVTPTPNRRAGFDLVAGLAAVMLVFAGSGYVSYQNTRTLTKDAREIARTHEVLSALDDVLALMTDAETGQRGFVLTGDAQYLEVHTTALARINARVADLEQLTMDDAAQQKLITELREHVHAKRLELEEAIELRRTQGFAAAQQAIATDSGKLAMDQIRAVIAQMKESENAIRNQHKAELEESYKIAVGSGILSGLLGMLLAAAVAYLVWRAAVARREQEWLQLGQVGLSQVMAGDPRLESLAEAVLKFLAEYFDAQAAVFFARDSGGFRRVASYGIPATTALPEVLLPNDGLLAQAVKDRRTFLVRGVPDGYVSYGSALGRATPRHLLIAPLKADATVTAVLELGFIHPLKNSAIELLDQVSESIGIAVRSANDRAHLENLLEETQRQGEELQAQSEELRVSNEELEEQGRVLKESQNRLEQQQAELEQTNQQLEEQSLRLEAQRDDVARSKAELQVQSDALEKASQYKSDFLANMSHELRTPLNSSLILAKLLADNPQKNLSDEQVRYAETIRSSGNDLLTLINDILDLSKIEAGHMEMQPASVVLSHLLNDLRRVFEPVANQKKLTFTIEAGASAPVSLNTDRQRLEQVLKNLLSNALKFTESGSVKLTVRSAPAGRVAFAVSDTGIGIAEHQQKMVFEAFRQADGTTHRKFGGTGLGLSISRELTRLLGGDLHLISAAGAGSTFTVTVPADYDAAQVREKTVEKESEPEAVPSPAAKKSQKNKPAAAASARRPRIADDRERLSGNQRVILVVEDDEPFARILYDLAHDLDFQCVIATTAEEALAVAAQHLPSAVVLDVGLPDNSGLSVLDRLKHDTRTRHIPVHVVSGGDYEETAMALGAVGYMLKPVKREDLVDTLESLEIRLDQRLRRVLVVEDDKVQLEALRKLLGSREVQTVGAGSMAECLEHLKNDTFDCMVLDLTLPDASGFALLETLSREDQYSFPPVIVYTGRELSADDEQKLRKYSKSIIIKGAKSPERLLDEVTLFLHQVVADLPQDKQRMLEKARHRDAAIEGRRILIVEDDVRNIFALTSILEPRGATVQIARNGKEGLAALEASKGNAQRTIDLVLMDVMMPEMDGVTATREIRKNPAWKKLPVIMLTAKAMKDDQQRCLDAGANDYMAKPLDVEKLLSLVRVWMPR